MRPNARRHVASCPQGWLAGAMQDPLDTDGVVMDGVKHDVASKDN